MAIVSKVLGLLVVGMLVGCAANDESTGREEAEAASTCSAADAIAAGSGSGSGSDTQGVTTKSLHPNDLKWNGPLFQGIRLNGISLNGPILQGINLNGLKLNGLNLNGLNLNGFSLNGATLNGVRLNGTELNGVATNGVRLNGLQLNGPIFQGAVLNGPVFQGAVLNGPVFQGPLLQGPMLQGISLQGTRFEGIPAGTRLDGAELEGELSDGTKIPIFIEHVIENADAKNADVVHYEVSYGDKHEPLCGVKEDGAPRLATALSNVWDETTGARLESSDKFTFACEGAALYKCVAAGYKPWMGAAAADYHQACTRMIRADYCGDGTSFTKDGTLIDMQDAEGLQSYETLTRPDFAFEASWGPNGATCVSKTRYPLTALPQCLKDRMADTCDVGAATESIRLTNRSATNNACLR